MFTVDFEKIGVHLLPSFLRKPKMLAWFRILLRPMQIVNNSLQQYVEKKRKEIHWNGQSIVLERALNITFNPGVDYDDALSSGNMSGCILIDNTSFLFKRIYRYYQSEKQGDGGFTYYQSEGQGDKGFFYFQSEQSSVYHFVIKIPSGLIYNADEVSRFVNNFKIAGKKFTIKTY